MKAFEALKTKLQAWTSLVSEQTRTRLVDQALHQALPTAILMLVLLLVYGLTVLVPSGWLTYGLSTVALLVIWLTSVARVNDITARGRRWHVRRLGLVLCGTVAVVLIAAPLFPPVDFPSWNDVLLRWGFALTWFTTPNMPPWWKYISGEERRTDRRNEEPQL